MVRGTVYRRGKKFWLNYMQNGQRVREFTTAKTEQEAKEILAEKLVVSQGVLQLLDIMVEDWQVRQIKSLRSCIEHLKPIRRLLGHYSIDDINSLKIRTYIKKRLDEEVVNGTINRELTLLKRAYNLGRMDGVIQVVPHIPLLPENNVRQGFLTEEQAHKVAGCAVSHLQDFILFAFYSGWRKGEIMSLTWQEVDMRHKVIRLAGYKTKTNDTRILPLVKDLLEIIYRRFKDMSEEYVFHYRGARLVDCSRGFSNAFKRAGLPDNTLHDLRRSAVRRMLVGGVPMNIAMRITGHKSPRIFNRYAIFHEEDLRDALEDL
jgi:integrase